jgi:hypothetical protein
MLDLSPRSVDYLIARGMLPSRKLGRRTVISRRVLQNFAASNEDCLLSGAPNDSLEAELMAEAQLT